MQTFLGLSVFGFAWTVSSWFADSVQLNILAVIIIQFRNWIFKGWTVGYTVKLSQQHWWFRNYWIEHKLLTSCEWTFHKHSLPSLVATQTDCWSNRYWSPTGAQSSPSEHDPTFKEILDKTFRIKLCHDKIILYLKNI